MKIKDFIRFAEEFIESFVLPDAEPDAYLCSWYGQETGIGPALWGTVIPDDRISKYMVPVKAAVPYRSSFARRAEKVSPVGHTASERRAYVFSRIAALTAEPSYNGYTVKPDGPLKSLCFDLSFAEAMAECYRKRSGDGKRNDHEFSRYVALLMAGRYEHMMKRAGELARELAPENDIAAYRTMGSALVALELTQFTDEDIEEATEAFFRRHPCS